MPRRDAVDEGLVANVVVQIEMYLVNSSDSMSGTKIFTK